jgi:hypothetical protein
MTDKTYDWKNEECRCGHPRKFHGAIKLLEAVLYGRGPCIQCDCRGFGDGGT